MSLREVMPEEENLPSCSVCGAMVKGGKCLSCGEPIKEGIMFSCMLSVKKCAYCGTACRYVCDLCLKPVCASHHGRHTTEDHLPTIPVGSQ